MSDDPLNIPTANESDENKLQTETLQQSQNVNPKESSSRPSSPTKDAGRTDAIGQEREEDKANDRSDSEAETVVLPGQKEAATDTTRKTIKNEDVSDSGQALESRVNGYHEREIDEQNSEGSERKPSLKRKRAIPDSTVDDHGNSSNLSSTVSSPAPQRHSSRDSPSESDRSRSTPPVEGDYLHTQVKPRKRKLAQQIPDHDRQKRGKSDPNSIASNRKERRGTRSANHHEVSHHRSESPPSRRRKREQSTQSIELQEKYKRKKAPPPLLVERQRKASEDTHGDSDDSSSVHSHPHLQKVASSDQTAMSPAKLSHRKNRDRNGRTLLARACAQDIDEARKWLKERPQDIDVPDNAGNTPLQIASLEGSMDIVKLLLDAGCDITCKNIDMETPLIDAVENGHLEVVQLLLEAGSDPRQSNAKGEEPLDLVNPENDDYDEIRAALIAAKEKTSVRRTSDDHTWHHRDNESAASPTDVPLGRSPPPLGLGARRRTARSQLTQDSLLWLNPSPENLRNAAEKGELTQVDHILKMRSEVHTEAIIAAARGGHDVVLEIFFAIGKLNQDPEPLQSDKYRPGANTPMLAAIGRGYIPVIKLLLSQPGFNPTRRPFRNLTYYELAKERKGSDWEEEYRILKEAFENFKNNGSRRSNHNSPKKVRPKRPESNGPLSEASTLPQPANKTLLSSPNTKRTSDTEIKRERSSKASSSKHLKPPDAENSSAILSDRDSEIPNQSKSISKTSRSVSDVGVVTTKNSESIKPRRKLLSRNDLKTDQDTKRRASLAIDASSQDYPRRKFNEPIPPSQEKPISKNSDPSVFSTERLQQALQAADDLRRRSQGPDPLIAKDGKDSGKDTVSTSNEPRKKRLRVSTSPQPSGLHLDKVSEIKKKKKRRVDSEGNAIMHELEASEPPVRPSQAMVVKMVPNSESVMSPTNQPSVAPVAFMGNPSPVTKSPEDIQPPRAHQSPMSGIEPTAQQDTDPNDTKKEEKDDEPRQQKRDQPSDDKAAQEKEAEKRQQEVDQERDAQVAREEAEKQDQAAREQEEARLEEQRKAEEAEKEAKKAQEEEEARLERRRQSEETQRRRIEQERIRREEQDRRRAEQEERERQHRIRIQELEEQQRLPNSLRRAAELDPDAARQPKEIKKWLPLFTVTTREIQPGCDEQMAEERWIANVQAAPVLAIKDLDLSQCECLLATLQYEVLTNRAFPADTAWTRHPLPPAQRQSLWRQVRNQMSQAVFNPFLTWAEAYALDQETYPKFRDLKSVFWIKLADFSDIVPRHPHLAGLRLSTRRMVLHEDPWGTAASGGGGGREKEREGGMVNGYR
ncbi:MAG: hypothetical protein Q9167_004633 [Letrouitia subvulpina]